MTSQGVLAWAFSDVGVDDPSDPESTFAEHTDFGFFGIDYSSAHNANYQNYLAGNPGSPTGTPTGPTTTTTTSTSTGPTASVSSGNAWT